MPFIIDEDVLRFLNGHLGQNDIDAFVRCSSFAYRDMCRTITYATAYNENSISVSKNATLEEKKAIIEKKRDISKKKEILRIEVTEIMKAKIQKWIKNPPKNFDAEHKELCETIIKRYEGTTDQSEPKNSIYFGQAQKWVNMTLKNLYVYSKSNAKTTLSLSSLLPYMHIPIDNVILDIASDKKKCYVDSCGTTYGLKKPSTAWSKWNYDTYIKYQNELKSKINSSTPILWELTHWSTVQD